MPDAARTAAAGADVRGRGGAWVDGPRALPPPDDPRLGPGRRRAHGSRPVRLVVLGDSFAFTDERGPVLPGAASVWPTVLATSLGVGLGVPVDVAVLASPARTVRDALDLVRKDRHVQFEVLARADAVVVALGSYDHAPIGVPAPVSALVPFVRPAAVRRRVRRSLHRAYPVLVRATGGRLSRTPWEAFASDYAALLAHVRSVAHGAAGVAVGPSSHQAAFYGRTHPRHGRRSAAQLALARAGGFATVDAWALVAGGPEGLNPDGIHWHRGAHARVGTAISGLLRAQLAGAADRPPRPGSGDGVVRSRTRV